MRVPATRSMTPVKMTMMALDPKSGCLSNKPTTQPMRMICGNMPTENVFMRSFFFVMEYAKTKTRVTLAISAG